MDAKTLKLTAEKNRKRLLEVIYNAGAGHTGGDLSCLNLLTVLYFHKLSLDLSNLKNPERDRFILSNCPGRSSTPSAGSSLLSQAIPR